MLSAEIVRVSTSANWATPPSWRSLARICARLKKPASFHIDMRATPAASRGGDPPARGELGDAAGLEVVGQDLRALEEAGVVPHRHARDLRGQPLRRSARAVDE